ncbi:hypothetical protein ABZX40_41330 [Streptomyces sp. NPDC004610]|uniref:hypothetical protein n=1 Tax=unclassified Streptomyces TaxID=2593676 RepID=UPI0033B396C6
MPRPIAYTEHNGRSWRCDGCGSHGRYPSITEGHRQAAETIALHTQDCTPEETATVTVDIAADLTIIRPGDTLLVLMPSTVQYAQLSAVTTRLTARLPGVEVIVIPAEGITVYRPDTTVGA